MVKSIDNLAALLMITLLMFFVFSLMGMQLFFNIDQGNSGSING
jgi:hypothetical protein